ncbi:hypothetical protein MSAN_02454400 [Mycena sanguinolenta]|uniref:DUF6534 domain-containing protein n=1 Tax=Mycena sanguinolenta TaxID=230812 RepID=A0A8H6WXW8_9AGAR|nr:hypothetical protein MSAN_02454400 [Mycena sanguinolenta]
MTLHPSLHLPEYMASQDTPVVPGTLGPAYVEIFGPIFWGFCVSLGLAGTSVSQAYLYFTRYNDKLSIRAATSVMIILDLLSTTLICQSVYYYILPHFGSLGPLGHVTGEINADCLISSAIAFISQMYFVYQLMIVPVKDRSMVAMILNILIVGFGVISLGAGIGCGIVMFEHPQFIFMNRIRAFSIVGGIHKASGAAADIVATVAMFMYLKSPDTGIPQGSSRVQSFVYFLVNRGLLVALAQFLTLVLLFSSTSRLYWVAVHINTTRLYANTFFAMLNARTPLELKHGLVVDVSRTRNRAVAPPQSPFEAAKFSEFGNDACGGVKMTATTIMMEDI